MYETLIKPAWIDHNGHMNVAYFVVAFDEATDAIYEDWGIGMAYPDSSGCSVFTLGMNIDYTAELFEGDAIRIETVLVDNDSKRIHYFHRMMRVCDGVPAATNECLAMNINLRTRKSCDFPPDVRRCLDTALHRGDPPKGFGRQLGIRHDKT